MRKLLTLLVILSFVLISFADEHSDKLKETYKPDSWDGKDSKNKSGFNLGGFETNGCKGGEIEHSPNNPSRREYTEGEKHTFNAFVQVCESAEKAHKLLLAFLGNVSHPDKMKSTSELELNIGHVGYVYYENGKAQWIAFVRNNVLIILSLTDTEANADLTKIGGEIDDEIEKQKDVDHIPKPVIKNFKAETTEINTEEKIGLEIAVDAKADGDVDYHFEIKGEGQGYVEKGADGKYYFKATGKGKVKIVVTTTNSLCNQSQSEVEIEVK